MPVDITVDEGTGQAPPASGGFMDQVSGFLGGPIGAALGSIGGGLFGQRSARKARQYQEALDNSRYQRAAADMEKAGLNRILALGGGASSFSGGAGVMPNVGETMVSGSEQSRKRKAQDLELQLIEQQIDTAWRQGKAHSAQALRDATQSEVNLQTRDAVKFDNTERKLMSDTLKELGPSGYALKLLIESLGGGSAKGIVDLIDRRTR